MTEPLPPLEDDAAFDRFVADDARATAALAKVAAVAGLRVPEERPPRGSALVGLTPTEVLKVFGPHDRAHADTECAALLALAQKLPVATPELVDDGEVDGWRWLRMTRLSGREAVDVWPTLASADRLALSTQLGEALAALHGEAPPSGITRVDWSRWCVERRASVVDIQRAKGCPPVLLDALPGYLAHADLAERRRGWLHTEVMLEHLLVAETARGWRWSGLLDFEPSWVAPVDYEFASVGLYFSGGDRDVLREVMRAHGTDIEPERLMAMALVHRYANLAAWLERLGGPEDLDALALRWFG